MNKHYIKYVVAFLPFAILLTSCSETFDNSVNISELPRMLSVSQTSFSYTAESQSKKFDVTSNNIPWRLDNNASWLSLSPEYGEGSADVSASVTENNTDTTRVTRARLSSNGISILRTFDLTFSQSAYEPYIHFDQNELILSADASSTSVIVESNREWNYSTSSSWLSVAREDDALVISTTLNEESSAREADIMVSSSSLTKTIHIIQRAAVVSSEQKCIEFGNGAESKTITINSDIRWTAECSQSWILVTPDNGTASDAITLTISVTDNSLAETRTGYVYLKVGNTNKFEIEVVQDGTQLSISPNELSFESKASNTKLQLHANAAWTLSVADESWFHLDKVSGDGDATINVSVDENTGSQRRNSVMLTNLLSGTTVQTITVVQDASELTVTPTKLSYNVTGGTRTLYITTDLPWLLVPSNSWITLSETEGEGNGEINVTVTSNPTLEARSGDIKLTNKTNNTVIKTVPVYQSAAEVVEDTCDLNHTFLSKGESLRLSSYETEAWTASVVSGESWISVSPTSGDYSQDIVITVTDNPNSESRQGCVRIVYGYHIYYCPIIQAGKTITISTTNVDFFARGGESQSITVTADKTANVSRDVSWLSIKQNGNAFTIVASQNTSSEMRTGKVTVSLSGVSDLDPVIVNVRQAGIDATFSGIGFEDDEDWNTGSQEDDDSENKTFTVNDVTFTMVAVEGGTFTMGATSEQTGYESNELPTHRVTLSSYMIGETEVTQELWQTVMGYKPTSGGKHWSSTYGLGAQYPAYYISWNNVQEFITKLNSITGETFRMPTEAEWEYASRGGNKSKGDLYSGSNTIGDVAWYYDNSGSKTHPVKTKSPNELGLYDMSGNVWEWCSDWYGSYSSNAQTDPTGPSSGSYRVIRGGSWSSYASSCRVASRYADYPSDRSGSIGFRLAL